MTTPRTSRRPGKLNWRPARTVLSGMTMWTVGPLTCAVSREDGRWHVSVSHRDRYPTWDEIADARERFTPDEATMAMVLPPSSEYVNLHETCLHLWEIDGDLAAPAPGRPTDATLLAIGYRVWGLYNEHGDPPDDPEWIWDEIKRLFGGPLTCDRDYQPPIGSVVQDPRHHEWQRGSDGWWQPVGNAAIRCDWPWLIDTCGPLTLVSKP